MLLCNPMLFRFNRLTLLANIFSLQFPQISEYQPSSSYRASKSRFSPYIHCKLFRVCPTTKVTSATVKLSMELPKMAEGSKKLRVVLSTHILLSLHYPMQLIFNPNQVICFPLFACMHLLIYE